MIRYNLICECKHSFDSWFASSDEYERLKKNRFLTCPQCNSQKIKKSIMSPNLKSKANKVLKSDLFEKKIRKKLVEVRNYVENNCKYVGDRFAQEARSIYYDKKTSKGIYGKATQDETNELLEEGIEIATIPWISKKN